MVSPDEMERIIEAAAERAMRPERMRPVLADTIAPLIRQSMEDAMLKMGIDSRDPIRLQKDLAHLRMWRESMEEAHAKGLIAVFTVALTGAIAMLALGIKQWIIGP